MSSAPFVLIVESDPALANLLVRLATDEGLATATARDGDAALDVVRTRGAPTAIVTNLNLPKRDGFALLADLHKLPLCEHVPAIVLSSSMTLRTAALTRKGELAIREILAPGMPADTMRRALRRTLGRDDRSIPPPTRESTTPGARISRSDRASALPTPPTPPTGKTVERHRDPARLARIAASNVIDDTSPPDEQLQRLVREAAEALGTPMALVSIVLDDRQWFKAHFGIGGKMLAERGTPVAQALCRHVVEQDTPLPLVIPNASEHPVFAANELVRTGTVQSYAGAPLLTSTGDVLGTLCILDDKPRSISAEQVDELQLLARRVAGEIELRTRARASADEAKRLRSQLEQQQATNAAMHNVLGYFEAVLSNLDQGVILFDEARRVTYASRPLADMLGIEQSKLVGMHRTVFVRHVSSLSDEPEVVQRALAAGPVGPFVGREDLSLARPTPRRLHWTSRPVDLPTGIAQLSVFTLVAEGDVTVDE